MQIGPQVPGVERSFGTAPTMDTERQAPFRTARNWTPSHIEIFGHSIDVDIPTGNLIISTTEVGYPYYNLSLGISRKYDAQEQHMQLSYLRNYPNVDPKPHWFGNWQFAYEADVDEVWLNTYPEIHVTSGVGANGLFEIRHPDFQRNLKDAHSTEELLRSYGIPGRTLAELSWKFTENDFLLRTLRGPFQILTGHFREETLVDSIHAQLWLFNPVSGSAFRISSEYFYNIQGAEYRDVGFPLIVTRVVDALGHGIELKPSPSGPPYTKYVLSDRSGREFYLDLDQELTFLDGLNPGGRVRKHLVSKVTDATKGVYNQFHYKYNAENLLEEIMFPSTIGNRYVRYHYEDPNRPGILTSIENSYGEKVQFRYAEDPTDNDERLNPRLKIREIVDPEGNTFEYEYDRAGSEVTATISKNGNIDRNVKYTYLRDIGNTKQRYVNSTEIEVRRGYATDSGGNVVPRQPAYPQIVRSRTEYTKDGRFNIEKEIDPLGRTVRFEYYEFNQIKKSWDFDDHWTEYSYDIPDNPSGGNPRRYDLRLLKRENILRAIDASSSSRAFVETVGAISKEYEYDRYDSDNAPDISDHGKQSTHRVFKEIDERRKIWTHIYDDVTNHNPLSPTLLESPLHFKTKYTYNNRGERETVTDPENNTHTYKYNNQGQLEEYTDPNRQKVALTYYADGNWLKTIEDQLSKVTQFVREADGRLRSVIDPVQDRIDYNYYKNDRLHKIICHRPAIPQNPADPKSPSLITPYQDIETEFRYSPLGGMTVLKNPKGLELLVDYDEAGRTYHWYHNIANPKQTKFIHDEAGQLERLVDRKGKSTVYTRFNSGFVKTIQYPDWSDGTSNIRGKLVEYKKYDHFGRVLSAVDSEIPGSKDLMYDEAGNLLVQREPVNFEIAFEYDDDNRLWHIKDSNGVVDLEATLDGLARPSYLRDSAALDGSLTWEYTYTKQVGPRLRVLNLFGISLPAVNLTSEYDYDEKGRITMLEHRPSNRPQNVIFRQDCQYRDDDLIQKITGSDADSFLYDGLKQLIFEAATGRFADYDQAGNRLHHLDLVATPNPPLNIYNDLNQLEKEVASSLVLAYDENGNLAKSVGAIQTTEFHFDGTDCLRRLKMGQYDIGYVYDFDGKLVERTVKDTIANTVDKTRLYYLLTRPVLVNRNDNPFMLATWDQHGNLLRIRWFQRAGQGAFPNSLFPTCNVFRDPVRLLDSNQRAAAEITYDAWGEILKLVDPDNLFELWGYRGGLLDRLSNLLLFGVRWYFPMTGRWISEDNLMNQFKGDPFQSAYESINNLYAYVGNEPISHVDPTGLIPRAMVPNEVIGNTKLVVNKITGGKFSETELNTLTDLVIDTLSLNPFSDVSFKKALSMGSINPKKIPLLLTPKELNLMDDIFKVLEKKDLLPVERNIVNLGKSEFYRALGEEKILVVSEESLHDF